MPQLLEARPLASTLASQRLMRNQEENSKVEEAEAEAEEKEAAEAAEALEVVPTEEASQEAARDRSTK